MPVWDDGLIATTWWWQSCLRLMIVRQWCDDDGTWATITEPYSTTTKPMHVARLPLGHHRCSTITVDHCLAAIVRLSSGHRYWTVIDPLTDWHHQVVAIRSPPFTEHSLFQKPTLVSLFSKIQMVMFVTYIYLIDIFKYEFYNYYNSNWWNSCLLK